MFSQTVGRTWLYAYSSFLSSVFSACHRRMERTFRLQRAPRLRPQCRGSSGQPTTRTRIKAAMDTRTPPSRKRGFPRGLTLNTFSLPFPVHSGRLTCTRARGPGGFYARGTPPPDPGVVLLAWRVGTSPQACSWASSVVTAWVPCQGCI